MNDPKFPEDSVVLFNQRFSCGHVEVPKAIAVKEPACMSKVGLLTPAERREVMEFEKYSLQAKRTRHKAELDEKRRRQIMVCRHPEGCVGVDGPVADGTYVYKAKFSTMKLKEDKMVLHAAKRVDFLAGKQSSVDKLQREFLGHDSSIKDGQATKFCQSKNRFNRPNLDSHQRLFADSPNQINPARTQHLRNEDLAGKNYNIVTGAGQEYARSNVPEKCPNSASHVNRQAHPSLIGAKLERFAQYTSVQSKNPLY